MQYGAHCSPCESMGKLHFTLFRSLLLLSSHLDDIWKLTLYLGMFLYVHEDSYKPIFNSNTCGNPPKTHQGALTLFLPHRKTQLGLQGDIFGQEDICQNNPFSSLWFFSHLKLFCPSCQHPADSFGLHYQQPCRSKSQDLANALSCSWLWQAPADVLQIGSNTHLCGAVTAVVVLKSGMMLLVHALHAAPGVCFRSLDMHIPSHCTKVS